MFIICPKCSAKYQLPEGISLSEGKKLKCSNCQHVFTWTEHATSETVSEAVFMSDAPRIVNVDPEPIEENVDSVFLPEETPASAQEEVLPPTNREVPQPFMPISSEPEEMEEASPKKRASSVWIKLVFCVLAVGALVILALQYPEWLSVDSLPKEFFAFNRPASVVESTNQETTPTSSVKEVEKKPVVVPAQADTYVQKDPQVILLPDIQSVRFEVRNIPEPTVRIEGVVKNMTEEAMTLPEKVRAVAYDETGSVLFQKDIYLTDRLLPAGEGRSFFGSYSPAPERIQWVDVTF